MSRVRAWHYVVLAAVCATVVVWANTNCGLSEVVSYALLLVLCGVGAFIFLAVRTRPDGKNRTTLALALGLAAFAVTLVAMVVTANCSNRHQAGALVCRCHFADWNP